MRRHFLKIISLSLVSAFLVTFNFVYASTKKLFNKNLTNQQKNIMFNEGTRDLSPVN